MPVDPGTRLYPLTKVTSKQLLPIYDKPMIYYPMSVLMNAGIRDIMIISTPQDTPRFQDLLGDGHQFGVNLQYAVQPSPDGLAQAFIIGADFIGDDTVTMVLGDSIFAGHGLKKTQRAAVENAETGKGATVFGYYVDDPERFGMLALTLQIKKLLKMLSLKLILMLLFIVQLGPLWIWQKMMTRLRLLEFYKQYGLATKVTPVTTEEYGLSKAARPSNSRLDKSKLVENGFEPLPTWQDAVRRYLEEARL